MKQVVPYFTEMRLKLFQILDRSEARVLKKVAIKKLVKYNEATAFTSIYSLSFTLSLSLSFTLSLKSSR